MARGRKTNSEDGVKADKQISLKVVPELYTKVKALSLVEHNGNVNALVTSLLEKATENPTGKFAEALKFQRSYETQMKKFMEGVAQDSEAEDIEVEPIKPKKPAKKKTAPADETATATGGDSAGENS